MLLGVWFPGGSILGLLLLCHLAVGEVCGPATPTSSAEFLIQLAFAEIVVVVVVIIVVVLSTSSSSSSSSSSSNICYRSGLLYPFTCVY